MSAASKARDFIARFVSDDTKFDVDPVERSLEDVETAAKQASQQVDRSFTGMGDSAEQFARDVQTAADRVRTELRQAATEGGEDFKHKLKETGAESGREVGSEFATNLGSSFSQNQGNFAQLGADSAAGLAGAFSSFPGFGAALAPLAIGAAAIFGNMVKSAQDTATRISAVFDTVTAQLGTQLEQTARGAWVQAWLEQLGGDNGVAGGIAKLRRLGDQAGVSMRDIGQALTEGGAPADALTKKLQDIVTAGTSYVTTVGGTQVKQLDDSAKNAQTLLDTLSKANTEQATGAENAALWNNAIYEMKTNAEDFEQALKRANVNGGDVLATLQAMNTINNKVGVGVYTNDAWNKIQQQALGFRG